MLLFIAALYLAGSFFHLALKLLGSKDVTLSETMGLYGYHLGIQSVGYELLIYPMIVTYGPVVAFGGSEEEMQLVAIEVAENPGSFMANWMFASAIGLIWVVFCMLPMYARYYGFLSFGKIRVGLALFAAAAAAAPILMQLLPLLHQVGKYL